MPWIAYFHPEITNSATRGFYAVLLFNKGLTDAALCLGQGVTQLRSEFKKAAVKEMLRRAALIRDRVPEYQPRFVAGPTSLAGSTQLSRDYDAAVAFYKAYHLDLLPARSSLNTILGRWQRCTSF